MADAPSSSGPKAPARSGNFFTRKSGPLPNWAWVSLGAGALVLWYLWQRSQASSASNTTTSAVPTTGATSTGGAPASGYGVGGYGGAGNSSAQPAPGYSGSSPTYYPGGNPGGPLTYTPPGLPPNEVAPLSPALPTQPQSPTTPGTTTLPFQVQSGSGWWPGGSNWATDTPQQQQQAVAKAQAAGPITDANGNEYEWIDAQEYQGLQGSGEQIYFEPLPGVFLPVPANMGSLAVGTPLYIQIPAGTPAGTAQASSGSAAA